MSGMAALVLVAVLAALSWMSWRDSLDYAEFKLLTASIDRIRFYRRWTLIPLALFGIGGYGLLLSLGRIDALWDLPAEFTKLIAPFEVARQSENSASDSLLGMAIGIALGLTVPAIIWRNRLKKMRQPVIGDIEALLPRNREEIFYRVALPILALEATGSVVASILISIAAFGLAHWYQGWKGVLATSAVGAFLFWLYLSSGSILKPMVVHVLIDLMGLIIRPAVSHYLANRDGAPGSSVSS